MKSVALAFALAACCGCQTLPAGTGADRSRISAGRAELASQVNSGLIRGYVLCDRGVDFMTRSAARLADYSVLLRTNRGDIHLEMWPQYAPNHVRNFLDLCSSEFYDGTVFHFVSADYGICGGDPSGQDVRPRRVGTSKVFGPRRLSLEVNALARHEPGVLSMDFYDDRDSASTMFKILTVSNPDWDGRRTAFGRVISGMDVVDAIARTKPTNTYHKPIDPQAILAAFVLVEADQDPDAGPGGFHVYESPAPQPGLRASAQLPFTAHATGDLAARLREYRAFADVSETLDPLETLLGENQLHISGPVDVRVGDIAFPARVIPDPAAYEAGPAIRVEATFLAHTGLRNEPFRWTVARPWLVSAQSGVSVDAIRAAIADKCGEGWEVACARSLCEPNALADQLTAALAARGSTEQVTARIEYLRSRSNELRKAAGEQKTRAYELERQIGDLESRDAAAQGLKSTTSALAGLSNDPLSGLHAAGAQIRLDAARAKNQQNRESLRRSADDAKQLAAKYEALADRADSMVAPLLELMYSTSGN